MKTKMVATSTESESRPANEALPGSWRLDRKDIVAVVVLFLLILITWAPRLRGPIDLRWDGAVYYVMGTSLGQGKGYRLLNEPGEIRATQYPPLLPAIIAAHQFILGTRDPVVVGEGLRISWFALFTLYTFAVYCLAKVYLSRLFAILITSIAVFNYHTIYMSNLCYPEILFSALTLVFFLVIVGPPRRIHSFIPFFLATACFLLRSSGITILATWVAQTVFERKYKRAAVRLSIVAIPFVAWMGYVAWVESTVEYNEPRYEYQRADYLFWNVSYAKNMIYKDPFAPELGKASFGDLLSRFSRNLVQVPTVYAELISLNRKAWYTSWEALILKTKLPIPWPLTFSLLILPGFLLFFGLVYWMLKGQWTISFYLLISTALICLVPWRDQMARYAVPLTPFLLVGLGKLMLSVRQFVGDEKRYKRVYFSAAGCLLVLILVQDVFPIKHLYGRDFAPGSLETNAGRHVSFRWFHYDASYRALDRGLDWLYNKARSDDIIVASMPQYVYLRTGCKSVMPPFVADPKEAQRLLESVPARFVVVDGIEFHTPSKYSMPPIATFRERWRKVYTDLSGGLSIYEFVERSER